MKTPEQLKGTIRSMATKKNLRAQEVLQMFLFERILDRLANCGLPEEFYPQRRTVDFLNDRHRRTNYNGYGYYRPWNSNGKRMVLSESSRKFLTVDVGDGIRFEYESIEPIREEDAYNNFFGCICVQSTEKSMHQ